MRVRKTFCNNCKKQTITIIDKFDKAVCWGCDHDKSMSIKREDDEENKEIKKHIKTFIILVIVSIATILLSTLLNIIFKWI